MQIQASCTAEAAKTIKEYHPCTQPRQKHPAFLSLPDNPQASSPCALPGRKRSLSGREESPAGVIFFQQVNRRGDASLTGACAAPAHFLVDHQKIRCWGGGGGGVRTMPETHNRARAAASVLGASLVRKQRCSLKPLSRGGVGAGLAWSYLREHLPLQCKVSEFLMASRE